MPARAKGHAREDELGLFALSPSPTWTVTTEPLAPSLHCALPPGLSWTRLGRRSRPSSEALLYCSKVVLQGLSVGHQYHAVVMSRGLRGSQSPTIKSSFTMTHNLERHLWQQLYKTNRRQSYDDNGQAMMIDDQDE
jgi:hypothetical protein